MSLFDLLLTLILAALLGVLAQRILGLHRGGWILTTVLGFLGVLLGRALVYQGGFPEPVPILVRGHPFPLFWSVVGGVVTTLIAAFLTRKWRKAERKR